MKERDKENWRDLECGGILSSSFFKNYNEKDRHKTLRIQFSQEKTKSHMSKYVRTNLPVTITTLTPAE